MLPERQVLSAEEIDFFVQNHYLHLKHCFPKAEAARLVKATFERMNIDPDDPASWTTSRPTTETHTVIDTKEFSPKAWGALCDLVGGVDKLLYPVMWNDGFIINLNWQADAWRPPGSDAPAFHVDGPCERRYLDNPEQALLVLVLWTDIQPGGGGTYWAADSVPHVARYLADRPEGLSEHVPARELVTHCSDFREATGEAGDVIFMHPLMIHSPSGNPSDKPRVLSNPVEYLKEPMDFNREDPADFSPVERATLNALGVERLDYRPIGDRPPRKKSDKPKEFERLLQQKAGRRRAG